VVVTVLVVSFVMALYFPFFCYHCSSFN